MPNTYKLFDPKVDKPLHEVSRKEAKEAFDWFIECIPNRIKELSKLAKLDNLVLDFSDESIVELEDWFYVIVNSYRDDGYIEPTPEVFSLCNDIGVYLSESIISHSSAVHWECFVSDKKGLSYQRPVILGFDVKNKNYHIDFDYLVCQYVFRILKGAEKENIFQDMYTKALSLLPK